MLDFEKTQSLYVKFKKDEDPHWHTCIKAPGIRDFIDHRHTYFEMFASTGKKYTLSVKLYEFFVYEKLHRLDIEERHAVQHELAKEIFDKMVYFTEEINEDKETLAQVTDTYKSVNIKTKALEIYIHDLFRGTKRLEEHMIEIMQRFSKMTPDSIPKMKKVKLMIAALEAKQTAIYNRFTNIRGILNSRQVFQNMRSSLQKMEGIALQLNEQIGSDAYQTFFGKTTKVMDLITTVDFGKMTDDVSLQGKPEDQRAAKTGK